MFNESKGQILPQRDKKKALDGDSGTYTESEKEIEGSYVEGFYLLSER